MVLETLVKKRPQLVHPPFGLGELSYWGFLYEPGSYRGLCTYLGSEEK